MHKLLAGFMIGVGASALVLLLGWLGWLERVELQSYDWRMRQAYRTRAAASPFPINADVVLVEITDASIRDLAPIAGRWPWPRALHALLVDYLARAPARVIALDIGFWEPERPASYEFLGRTITSRVSDQSLADAVGRAGNVILLADSVNPGMTGGENPPPATWNAPPYGLDTSLEERPVVTLPYDDLARKATGFGHNFLVLDRDGPARRIAPFIRQGTRFMPALGVAAALAAGKYGADDVSQNGEWIRVGNGRIPLVRQEVPARDGSSRRAQWTMLINFRAPLANENGERPFRSYEARHLLVAEGQILDGQKPDVDPAVFRDKVVFVGLAASGLVDVFQTPHGGGMMPGIQLHASVADTVLSHLYIREASGWTRWLATVGGAVAIGIASATLPFAVAAGGAGLLVAGWTLVTLLAFRQGLWINSIQPVLGVALSLFAGTAYRYFVEGREKRKVKRLFGRYVSKDVYEQLLANPDLAELGGGRREMSVLFSDIRGFTSVTEKGNPEELVTQLNEYFSRMVAVVFRHHGTVDKFVGDMVMALFGAPLDDRDHADHAVAAAVDMVRELGELNLTWKADGRPGLDIGIGVNSGEMIAGNIGSSAIMSYTVIGDNVNLGSRLESLNKDYRTRIIISDATRSRLKGFYEIRPLGDVVVKGKTKPVAIHEVCVPSPLPVPTGAEEKIEKVL